GLVALLDLGGGVDAHGEGDEDAGGGEEPGGDGASGIGGDGGGDGGAVGVLGDDGAASGFDGACEVCGEGGLVGVGFVECEDEFADGVFVVGVDVVVGAE